MKKKTNFYFYFVDAKTMTQDDGYLRKLGCRLVSPFFYYTFAITN